MKPFTVLEGFGAALMQDNIDTDVIVRIERIAKLKRGEFSPWAFEALRYRADGSENPDFVLNREPFRHAKILISGANFGCGSSREMAVWSIEEFGIRCLIAQSYGDIFYGNCLQNGVLPIRLERGQLDALATAAATGEPITVDLAAGTISNATTGTIGFDFPPAQRDALLSGQDEVDQTLAMASAIGQFQLADRLRRPWVYPGAVAAARPESPPSR
jgi:3-isopropylmalate/(R)-2-methylmalate dehydratase small subunit